LNPGILSSALLLILRKRRDFYWLEAENWAESDEKVGAVE
jgi:hypothetical protein